ncbi:MAG: hypothetical protein AAFN70_04170, partial [Planctomycetota bacterium]
ACLIMAGVLFFGAIWLLIDAGNATEYVAALTIYAGLSGLFTWMPGILILRCGLTTRKSVQNQQAPNMLQMLTAQMWMWRVVGGFVFLCVALLIGYLLWVISLNVS